MDIFIQEMLTDFESFLIKPLVRVINKHYGRSVKGILSEPIKRFPHIRVSSKYPSITYNRGNKNPEYSIVLSKTYPTGGK